MKDEFGLTEEDHREQAARKRLLEMRDKFPRVRISFFARVRAWIFLWIGI